MYVYKKEQTNIGLYDTALLDLDSYALFRNKKFSGLDRIAPENQISLGLFSQLWTDQGKEIGGLSISKLFYFDDSNIINILDDNNNIEILPVFIINWYVLLSQEWSLLSTLDFNSDNFHLYQGNVFMDYLTDNNNIQFSYRYASNLKNINAESNTLNTNEINQIGIQLHSNLSNQYSFISDYYYDLNDSRKLELYTGLQFESCCWYLNIAYFNQLSTSTSVNKKAEDNKHGLAFGFSLNGLGNVSQKRAQKKLRNSLFGEKTVYYR